MALLFGVCFFFYLNEQGNKTHNNTEKQNGLSKNVAIAEYLNHIEYLL
jgi:hypothetical protein